MIVPASGVLNYKYYFSQGQASMAASFLDHIVEWILSNTIDNRKSKSSRQ